MLFGLNFAAIFSLLVLGGGNDVLDYMSSDAYWKAKGVQVSLEQLKAELAPVKEADVSALIRQLGNDDAKVRDAASARIEAIGPAALASVKAILDSADPEVATRAKRIVDDLSIAQKATCIRRLMAIRTLGETKRPEAVPALEALLDSKESFVRDYCLAAIAAIGGKPQPGRSVPTHKQLLAETALLPGICDVVVQLALAGKEVRSIDKLLGQLPPVEGLDRAKLATKCVELLLPMVEKIGNVRVDSVTLGICPGQEGAPGMFLFRGSYDSHAAIEALKAVGMESRTIEGMEVFQLAPHTQMALILPSDDRLILLAGDNEEKLAFKDAAAALKGQAPGKRGEVFTRVEPLIAPAGSEDRRLWVALNIVDAMRDGAPEEVKAFEALTMLVQRQADSLVMHTEGNGANADKVKAAVEKLQNGIQDALKTIDALPPQFKCVKGILESIKVQADGTKATLDVSIDYNSLMSLLSGLGTLFQGKAMQDEVDVEVPPVVDQMSQPKVDAPK